MLSVSGTSLKGANDQGIADYAAKNNMTILTLDTDFAQIYHNSPKGTLGVIVVRVRHSTPAAILETLTRAHQKINLKETHNQLIIITQKKIRIIS